MMKSRGMGIMNPSKMPKAKVITRKDNPNKVKKFSGGGETSLDLPGPSFAARKNIDEDLALEAKVAPDISERGISSRARLAAIKNLAKDLDLEAFLMAEGSKSKGMPSKGEVTGGGLKLTKRFKSGGLYENIHKKRKRIAAGSGEKMRKPGSKGAPTAEAFRKSALTAKK